MMLWSMLRMLGSLLVGLCCVIGPRDAVVVVVVIAGRLPAGSSVGELFRPSRGQRVWGCAAAVRQAGRDPSGVWVTSNTGVGAVQRGVAPIRGSAAVVSVASLMLLCNPIQISSYPCPCVVCGTTVLLGFMCRPHILIPGASRVGMHPHRGYRYPLATVCAVGHTGSTWTTASRMQVRAPAVTLLSGQWCSSPCTLLACSWPTI